MKIAYRIKSLEKAMTDNREHWAVFSIGSYENPEEEKRVQKRIVEEYIAGGARPTHSIFVNEVPGVSIPYSCKERFLSSFSR